MALHPTPRVIRAYSLPVAQFDTLKTYQRLLQNQADLEAGTVAQEGDAHWITNSHALAHIIHLHSGIAVVAGMASMFPGPFVAALQLGDLVAAPREVEA
jgi:hypothetical protein